MSEKLGGEVCEALSVEAAGAGLGEEVGAEHESAIGERDGRGDMARIAVLRLDRAEGGGLVWSQYDGEILGGLVAHGLGDKVGECHIAAAMSVMSVDTLVLRSDRSMSSPIE